MGNGTTYHVFIYPRFVRRSFLFTFYGMKIVIAKKENNANGTKDLCMEFIASPPCLFFITN